MERFNIDDMWAYADKLYNIPEHLRSAEMHHDAEGISEQIKTATEKGDLSAINQAVRQLACISGAAALLCMAGIREAEAATS